MFIVVATLLLSLVGLLNTSREHFTPEYNITLPARNTEFSSKALETIKVSDETADIDYKREYFGESWGSINGCDTRDVILYRDLLDSSVGSDCIVASGNLVDPYTGKVIKFIRGKDTSSKVQIDHVVALSDAWKKGAYLLSNETRLELANDPLELLAVDGNENMKKSDSDASKWLPKNIGYRCEYVSRQIAVKQKYNLWVSIKEKLTIKTVLANCPQQRLPGK